MTDRCLQMIALTTLLHGPYPSFYRLAGGIEKYQPALSLSARVDQCNWALQVEYILITH